MDKLDLAKKKREEDKKPPKAAMINLDQTDQLNKLEELNTSIKSLWELINDKEEYDFDKLYDQLELLNKTLDFKEQLSALKDSVEGSKVESVSIKQFSELLDAIKENKPLPVEIDLSKLEKAIIQVEQRISEQSVPDKVGAEDYKPVRRVVKVGNKLIFDDRITPTSSGGGSSSGGGNVVITDSGGEAATVTNNKLDVNASIDTTGLATTATDTNTGNSATSLAIMDDWDESDRAKVNPIVGQAGVAAGTGTRGTTTQRVTIATDDEAVASLSVLDDWDETDRAKVNLIVGQAGVAANAGAVSATTQRVVQSNDSGKTLVSAGGSVNSNGNNTLISAGTNKLKIFAFSLSTTSSTAVTCIFQSGASGTELWRVLLQAPSSVSTGANLAVTPPAYLFATAAATLLNLNLSSGQTIHWSCSYYDEA